MKKNTGYIIGLALAGLVLAASCGGGKSDDPNHIKVGVETGPEYSVALKAKEVAKERYGLEVELVAFNDYVMPNTALDQGDLDANAFQHGLYLEEQSRQRGYRFVPVGKTFLYPIGAYSRKISSIDELKEGNTIAIPNDITNGGRALLLLQKAGLLTLRDSTTATPRVVDITGNPKRLKIVELEAPQLPRVLDDASVTIAVINSTFAIQAGLFLDNALLIEDKDSPYVNLIVAREDNKDADKVKRFVKAYQSDEVARMAEQEFKGGAVRGW